VNRTTIRPAPFFMFLVCVLTTYGVACGGGDDGVDPASGDGDGPVLTIRNETDCNVHIRFDNGRPVAAVGPGASQEYVDERLGTYRFMQVESTMAIFRNIDMAAVREDDWSVTIRPAFEDGECVDAPDAPS
jgi:hypothetical protein